jgi:hypothetical protein
LKCISNEKVDLKKLEIFKELMKFKVKNSSGGGDKLNKLKCNAQCIKQLIKNLCVMMLHMLWL